MNRRRIPIRSDRVRHPPAEGFSWVDRRFLRQHVAGLSRSAILLYFFLAAASNKHGLSFYQDVTIGALLKLDPREIEEARQELIRHDLIAYQAPLAQVLSLPTAPPSRTGGEPQILHSILRDLLEGPS